MAEVEPYLTPDEVCQHFKIGRERLTKFVNDGLPYIPINKRDKRFKASVVADWIERTIGQTTKPQDASNDLQDKQRESPKPPHARKPRKNGAKISYLPKQR